MRVDGPLRLPRRPARVEDERRFVRGREALRPTAGGGPSRLLEREETDSPLRREGREASCVLGVGERERGPRVVEDVRVLGGGVGKRERNRDASGAPGAEERRDERSARRGEDRDALPVQVRAPREERRGDRLRRREEAAVRRPPARIDNGGPLPVGADPIEEAQRSNVSLAMMSLWIWLVPS